MLKCMEGKCKTAQESQLMGLVTVVLLHAQWWKYFETEHRPELSVERNQNKKTEQRGRDIVRNPCCRVTS
jgi:hypothetical protein